jgi:hypothetical protein
MRPGDSPGNSVKPAKPVRLTQAIVLQVAKTIQKSVLNCFKSNEAVLPTREGVVQVAMTIEPSGEVSSARLMTESLLGTPVESCVVKVVSKARFPRHVGPAITVRVPFSYRPSP